MSPRILNQLRVFVSPTQMLYWAATSGKEALETLQREEVHVIVADRLMPEMDGFELLKTIRKKYPNIVGILLSGYTEMDTVQKAVNQGEIFRFIPKPWKLGEDFIKVVRKAIEHYNLQSESGRSGGRKREKCKAKRRDLVQTNR